jgi:hypothetical protein
MKYLKHKWIAIFISILFLPGCSDDFLVKPPVDAITDANFYKTDQQVMASTALLYNNTWFDYNSSASFALGDFRGGCASNQYAYSDNIKFQATGDSPNNTSAYKAFFVVIGQSNLAINNINKYAGAGVSAAIKKEAIAEARFMRACAYRNLVMSWGDVPIIVNNQEHFNDTTISRNTIKSVWRFITNEMIAIANDLPEIPYSEGRVTKWSAEGMLARFYLTRAGVESVNGIRKQEYLDSAKYYSKRVIELSGKKLLTDYAALFKFPYDNNNESLFELQWVYSETWGVSNAAPAGLGNGEWGIGNGDGWGGSTTATWWMLQQYEGINPYGTTGDTIRGRTLDQRLKATFFLSGASYPEVIKKTTVDGKDVFTSFVVPNNSGEVSSACIKKYICGNAVGMGGQASSQHYPNNTYMLRLAEMYLIYAEAVLGNNTETNDPTAISYYNEVHKRAGLAAFNKSGLTFDDIFKERLVEFAMEGMIWYDLSSLYYYNPNKALKILNSQDRREFGIYPDVYPNPTQWTFVKTSWIKKSERYINANTGNFYLPIPTAELAGAPNLLKPAVDYYNK